MLAVKWNVCHKWKIKFLGVEGELLDYLNLYVKFLYDKDLDLSYKTQKKSMHLGYRMGN